MKVYQVRRYSMTRLDLSGLLFSVALNATTAKTKIELIEKQTKVKKQLVNQFHDTLYFIFPLKNEKTSGYLIFSRGIERDQWQEMG